MLRGHAGCRAGAVVPTTAAAPLARRRCFAASADADFRAERRAAGRPEGPRNGNYRAKAAVQKLKHDNPDVQAGINIVSKVLEAPIRQIAENAGVEGSIVVGKITDNKSVTFGFDAQREEYGDMLQAGIVDPVKVVRIALQDAASVAALLITTEAMVAEAPKKESAPAMPGGGGMGGMDY